MAELLTLNELKERLGTSGDWDADTEAKYTAAIRSATAAIRNYAGRDFATSSVSEVRTYEYDGSGFLDVDDASAITAVAFSTGGLDSPLQAEQWQAQPHNGPVYEWIRLPRGTGYASAAMGFTRNLDVLAAEGRFGQAPTLVKVTATWGWPTVPEDVKQAAVWTVVAFVTAPEPFQQKSIEGYSVTIGDIPTDAIPPRAQAALHPYIRHNA